MPTTLTKITTNTLSLLVLLLVACQNGEQHYSNHLINESSPYLLQHAHNPVDWHPWGEEALQKAKDENKLLLISVGYAACHWCHVMEEESFEDTTVARIMNEHFVAIKVDREERPDIDDVYMTACQLASENGCGWPLNAFALPDGRPVWAGTYFPKENWLEILDYFQKEYKTAPKKMEAYADDLLKGITSSTQMKAVPVPESISPTPAHELAQTLLSEQDLQRGGRQGTQKFPMPNNYQFLLAAAYHTADSNLSNAVYTTLDNMALGGIYDQLGGGFARYSVDPDWKVPHFEKMLYDNGQLLSLYAQAYQQTQKPLYAQIIRQTTAFLERELAGAEGAFYSSLDADSEGEEGTFYVWTQDELQQALPTDAFEFVRTYYQITEAGNWENGKNVLFPLKKKITTEQQQLLAEARKTLFEQRQQRQRPGLDDKILCSWNALVLQGYLDAAAALQEPIYLERALQVGTFINDKLMRKDGQLWRNYKDGKTSINAFLDDYALTIQAFTSLYEHTFDTRWLERANVLAQHVLQHFSDDSTGLFYYTSDLDPPLVTRKMELHDNVIPASNSAMARALLHLGTLLYETSYIQRAQQQLSAISAEIKDSPYGTGYSNWGMLQLELGHALYEVAVCGPDAAAVRNKLLRHYLPNTLLLGSTTDSNMELLKGKFDPEVTRIYVCRDKLCKLPVEEVEAALQQLRE